MFLNNKIHFRNILRVLFTSKLVISFAGLRQVSDDIRQVAKLLLIFYVGHPLVLVNINKNRRRAFDFLTFIFAI